MIKQKILITGVAGFIGHHIAEKLLEKGCKIIGVDNLSSSYPLSTYKQIIQRLEKYKHFEFFKIDICNKKEILQLIKKNRPDYLIHSAAKAGIAASLKNPTVYLKTNAIGTINLLEALRLHSPKTKSILLSSSSVYGKQNKIPLSEDMQPNPLSPYGLSKYLMELIAKQYFYLYKLPIVIIRPFSIYGPMGRLDMAPYLAIQAAKTGKEFIVYGNDTNNRRSWTYIDDFVEGVIKIVISYQFLSFEIFNFGNKQSLGIDQFTLTVDKLMKKYLSLRLMTAKKPRRQFEMTVNLLSIKKAKRILDYYPKTQFEIGFRKIIQSLLNEKAN